jgi:hypothetical protein
MKRNLSSLVFLALAISASACPVLADETTNKPGKSVSTESKKTGKKAKDQAPAKTIEMFQAMDQGLLTVDYIGKDATQANLIFRNQTGEPLDVVLPKTFGAVHVLAQGMMVWAVWAAVAWAGWAAVAWAAAKAWAAAWVAWAAAWAAWAAVAWAVWEAVAWAAWAE